ncbi:Putative helicase [Azospirillum argentinense]|uniref:DEAD/DEAH box helicase n=1 Tax=Azospirillum argentinense TaxID=2970906 RepID=UPI0032E016DC
MSGPLILASSCVGAQILNAPREVKQLLSDQLSYAVDGHEHMNAFKAGRWDGRSSFFRWEDGKFPAGFAMNIHDKLVEEGHPVKLVRKPRPAPKGPDDFHLFGGRGTDPRYDYQPEVVRQLIRHGMGIARIATGGGKSWVATLGIHRIRRMTLFLTTRGVLMHQMGEALRESGFKVGVLGDGAWAPSAVNVAMVQTLVARLKEPEPHDTSAEAERQRRVRAQTIKILGMVEFVIGEEAHEAGGNSYFEILRHCRNAHYRLALTATPFMRPDAEANMRLMAAFGGVIAEVSEKLLIDRGILATPYFKFVETPKPAKLFKSTPWPRAYKLGVVENEERNAAIVREALRAVAHGLPVMILAQHKAHGGRLQEMLLAAGCRAKFMYGDHDQDARKRYLTALATGVIQVLIGTTILDVGVDVPAVGMVILAGGGKAEVATRQRIGRGLRAKKTGPNVAFVVDFLDPHNAHLRGHARQRLEIVTSTPGFAERLLAPGVDFDYVGLGLTRRAA